MTGPQAVRTGIAIGRQEAFKVTAFTRAAVLVGLHGHMDTRLWLRLVGEFWASTDGDKRALVGLIRAYGDWRPMMNREEARAWRNLPARFYAWRGCYEGFNEDGLSYTTDNDSARAYPFLARYRMAGFVPVLRCVSIDKDDCIVKVDRCQAELLARAVSEHDRLTLDWSVSPRAFAGQQRDRDGVEPARAGSFAPQTPCRPCTSRRHCVSGSSGRRSWPWGAPHRPLAAPSGPLRGRANVFSGSPSPTCGGAVLGAVGPHPYGCPRGRLTASSG